MPVRVLFNCIVKEFELRAKGKIYFTGNTVLLQY